MSLVITVLKQIEDYLVEMSDRNIWLSAKK